MPKTPTVPRQVITLWNGHHWQFETIHTRTAGRDDLPPVIQVGYHQHTLPFVLAGFCGEVPLYRQADDAE